MWTRTPASWPWRSVRTEPSGRRPAFPEEPAGYIYDGERPLRAEELDDPFRRGILTVARATSEAELTWLRATVDSLDSGHRR